MAGRSPMFRKKKAAMLVLEDGTVFEGYSVGADVSSEGEVVFSTGLVGYPQSLTDPSYCGQILAFTYPLIGNYGVPALKRNSHSIPLNFESDRIQVSGVVVAEASFEPSHHSTNLSFPEWLKQEGVPGIAGIDTRALTRLLREHGVMKGKILVEGARLAHTNLEKADSPVKVVSVKEPIRYPAGPGAPKLVLVDCGVKANILRILIDSGVDVTRVPWDYPFETLEYDGLFLSNGPGDPKACTRTIAHLRHALTQKRPIFGICLGTQLMALAAGADTYKLKYGHRGQNQPAIERTSGRCYITSQNHGYAVQEASLPPGWESWFTNGNDGTVEGIRAAGAPFKAVQFHPEGCPGPRDTEFLIHQFLDEVQNRRSAK